MPAVLESGKCPINVRVNHFCWHVKAGAWAWERAQIFPRNVRPERESVEEAGRKQPFRAASAVLLAQGVTLVLLGRGAVGFLPEGHCSGTGLLRCQLLPG